MVSPPRLLSCEFLCEVDEAVVPLLGPVLRDTDVP